MKISNLIGLLAFVIKKSFLMFIAFVWLFPISLYTAMTPSIFKLFGITSVLYLFGYFDDM